MATIAEQLTSLANTKTAIKDAIVAKGVAVADTDPFSAYAGKIGQISGGGGAPATKFGVSIDDLFGDVDANGAYTQPTKTFEFDATKIKTVNILPEQDTYSSTYLLSYLFFENKNLVGTIDLSNFSGWTSANKRPITYLFEQAFAGSGIKKVILPTVLNQATKTAYLYYSFSECDLDLVIFPMGMYTERSVADQSLILQNTFEYCKIREIQGLENIENLAKSELNYTFYNATLPEELRFDSLTTIGETSFYRTFANAKGLKRLYFSALVNVNPKGFGNTSTNFMLRQNSVVEEIHFRADMQSTIESMDGYADKWGATNAAIYFDL